MIDVVCGKVHGQVLRVAEGSVQLRPRDPISVVNFAVNSNETNSVVNFAENYIGVDLRAKDGLVINSGVSNGDQDVTEKRSFLTSIAQRESNLKRACPA